MSLMTFKTVFERERTEVMSVEKNLGRGERRPRYILRATLPLLTNLG